MTHDALQIFVEKEEVMELGQQNQLLRYVEGQGEEVNLWKYLIDTPNLPAQEMVKSLERLNNDCILAHLRFGKQTLHIFSELMFVDEAHFRMTQQWSNYVGKLMTSIFCESARQSTPWSRGSRLTLPHS